MGILSATVRTLAGIPEPAVVNRIVDQLLAPYLHLGIRIDNGPALSIETGTGPLHELLAERPKPHFTARGSNSFEARNTLCESRIGPVTAPGRVLL